MCFTPRFLARVVVVVVEIGKQTATPRPALVIFIMM
jgi:hypothetical protein